MSLFHASSACLVHGDPQSAMCSNRVPDRLTCAWHRSCSSTLFRQPTNLRPFRQAGQALMGFASNSVRKPFAEHFEESRLVPVR